MKLGSRKLSATYEFICETTELEPDANDAETASHQGRWLNVNINVAYVAHSCVSDESHANFIDRIPMLRQQPYG